MCKVKKNLSAAEYFIVVQKEYIISEFRKKIYYSKNDKIYYQRVMDGKRKKINDIARRNNLDSIFNNKDIMNQLRQELFNEKGKPIFSLNETDINNYYSTGNEFSYKGDIWILDAIKLDGTLILYSPRLQQYEETEKDEVCRIL